MQATVSEQVYAHKPSRLNWNFSHIGLRLGLGFFAVETNSVHTTIVIGLRPEFGLDLGLCDSKSTVHVVSTVSFKSGMTALYQSKYQYYWYLAHTIMFLFPFHIGGAFSFRSLPKYGRCAGSSPPGAEGEMRVLLRYRICIMHQSCYLKVET